MSEEQKEANENGVPKKPVIDDVEDDIIIKGFKSEKDDPEEEDG